MRTFAISHTHRTWKTIRKNALQISWTNSTILSNRKREKILPEPDGKLAEQPLVYLPFEDVPKAMKIKRPVHIVFLRVISCEGDIFPRFIFSHGLTRNMKVYIKWLEVIVLPQIERVATGRPYVCRTSVRTQSWR